MDRSPLSEEQLAQLIDRRLRDLPNPKAPQALSVKVMAALLAHQARPWWRRSWVFWPRHFQILFVTLVFGLAAAAVWFFGGVDLVGPVVRGRDILFTHLAFLRPVQLIASAVVEFGTKLVHSVRPIFWFAIAGVVGAAYTSCLGLGTFCYRLAVRSTIQ